MSDRPRPPDDISPLEFFTRWIPASVEGDRDRRGRLGATRAVLVFEILGDGGGPFTLHIAEGVVRGEPGRAAREPDLEVRVDFETWRLLNRGELSAPEALLRRRVRIHGDWLLALKLHLILG